MQLGGFLLNKYKALKATSIVLGILFVILVAVSFSKNDAAITVFSAFFAVAFVSECVFGIMCLFDKKKRRLPKHKKLCNHFNVLITCKTTSLLKYHIIIDGKKVGEIKNGEHLCLNLPIGVHTIFFKSWGEKTKILSFEVNSTNVEINFRRTFKSSVEIRPLTTKTLDRIIKQIYQKQTGIKKVEVLDVHQSDNAREYPLYSLLVIFKDGNREYLNLRGNSKLFKDLQIYINEKEIEKLDRYRPFTDEELDTYDLFDGD